MKIYNFLFIIKLIQQSFTTLYISKYFKFRENLQSSRGVKIQFTAPVKNSTRKLKAPNARRVKNTETSFLEHSSKGKPYIQFN
jgi:hypothetical protein